MAHASHVPLRGRQWLSRREMLLSAGGGFGALALASLLPAAQAAAAPSAGRPTQGRSAKPPHLPAKAKSVIFLFMEGGPSHIDLFDPKPELDRLAGQKLPKSFKPVILPMGEHDSPLMPSRRKSAQHGEGGLWISDWLPHMATCADDLCVVRSLYSDGLNHSGGVCQMNTGSIFAGRPSLGAWVTYGLGTENENLPAFVVMEDNPGKVVNGPRNWGAGFMPAVYQGTAIEGGEEPIRYLTSPRGVTSQRQQAKLALLEAMNRRHAALRPEQSELEARIASYELAFRMQAAAPELVDLSQETQATLDMYGCDRPEPTDVGGRGSGPNVFKQFARNCLLARRLVERGVRFVTLVHASWDHHSNLDEELGYCARMADQPLAALIKDLKQRGLLDSTLLVFAGEFGRTPLGENRKGRENETKLGRDHHPFAFSVWLAGGGFRGGLVYGKTDDIGWSVVENPVHIHDLHATILHQFGFDHRRLAVKYKGLNVRLTDQGGRVVHDLIT